MEDQIDSILMVKVKDVINIIDPFTEVPVAFRPEALQKYI
jgi:hypothetical protein